MFKECVDVRGEEMAATAREHLAQNSLILWPLVVPVLERVTLLIPAHCFSRPPEQLVEVRADANDGCLQDNSILAAKEVKGSVETLGLRINHDGGRDWREGSPCKPVLQSREIHLIVENDI